MNGILLGIEVFFGFLAGAALLIAAIMLALFVFFFLSELVRDTVYAVKRFVGFGRVKALRAVGR